MPAPRKTLAQARAFVEWQTIFLVDPAWTDAELLTWYQELCDYWWERVGEALPPFGLKR